MAPLEMLVVALSAGAGSAMAVLAVVRLELRAVRVDVRRAHSRIDMLEVCQ